MGLTSIINNCFKWKEKDELRKENISDNKKKKNSVNKEAKNDYIWKNRTVQNP